MVQSLSQANNHFMRTEAVLCRMLFQILMENCILNIPAHPDHRKKVNFGHNQTFGPDF